MAAHGVALHARSLTMMNRRTLIHAAAAMAVATWVAVPQAALAHQPVRRLALRPWAAGVEKEQHIVVAIGQLPTAALHAQRRTLDGSHSDAGQQANAHGEAQRADGEDALLKLLPKPEAAAEHEIGRAHV